MNILNEANLLKKIAILVACLGVSVAIAPAASAQLNPRPSIFNEPLYNRAFAPRPKPRHGNRAEPLRGRHGHAPRPRPPMSLRPINGAPPPLPRFEGARPAPPAGAHPRHQAPRPRLSEPRAPRLTNRVPSAPPDRVYDAPNPLGNGTTPPPPRSPNAPIIVPPPGSP